MNVKIAHFCLDYLPRQSDVAQNPDWTQVEAAVRLLDGSEGQLELFEDKRGGLIITICGKSQAYTIQTNLMVMTDSREEESEEGEPIFGNLCPKHYLIKDVDTILKVLRKLIDTGRHYDQQPYIWRSNFG